jgi:hypothetical protein
MSPANPIKTELGSIAKAWFDPHHSRESEPWTSPARFFESITTRYSRRISAVSNHEARMGDLTIEPENYFAGAAAFLPAAPPFGAAAVWAGRYLAMIAGSTCAIAVSGSRVQVSSRPSSEMPR